jgi:NAD(P)-dependent dehydrogenase (short-subunit alcohol dehydrogenase family)
MQINLTDQVVVVTGASSGIGASTAQMMAESGAKVLAVGRHKERLQQIAGASKSIIPVEADLVDDKGLDAIVAAAKAAGGRIHSLVHTAGHFENATFEETPISQLDDFLKVHVRAPFLLTQRLLPMIRPKGTIIFYSSIVAHVGFAPYAAYTAAKGAIESMARSLATEFAPEIRVNIVAPGFTFTPMMTNQFDVTEGMEEAIRVRTPLRFIGGPEHCAAMTVLLCSDHGAYISGQTLVIDGGWKNQGWQA